jgi:hypothetical protein
MLSENPSRTAVSMLETNLFDAAFNFPLDHPAIEHEPVRLEPVIMMIPAGHAHQALDRDPCSLRARSTGLIASTSS